ncbi:MAG: heme biosynthesis HemY N-terminal domain-containing protein [Xanthobacteraceae bacterium]|jgi:HemY protein
MIRIIFFLIVVGALALGAAWLADRPGEVVVTWQGWRIETSVMVLGAAALTALAALVLVWSIVSAILRSPFAFRRHRHRRRGERAYQAISHGLIAVGAGDLDAARKYVAEAKRIAPTEPLALLLSAQSAQLAGDRETAASVFRDMANRPDTKTLGLHGLFVEARRSHDYENARAIAEEAARENPALTWAGKAVLEARSLAGDWAGALAHLEANKKTLDKDVYRRQRAVMLTARAQALEESDRDAAKAFALEAAKLTPTFVPAATLAGRMLAEGGEFRKAARLISRAWQANPHPDLAQVFSNLRFGDAARDRLKRVEALAKSVPGHIEGALAVARAAIDAGDFAKARAALASYLTAPTKRVALLMAELERAASNDEGRAREWLARALSAAPDPVWTAEGYISDRWLAVSPSGRLDGFEWRVPLRGIASPAPVIDAGSADSMTKEVAGEAQSPRGPVANGEKGEPANTATVPAAARQGRTVEQAQVAPIIPLIHAPDDPGPEAAEEPDPRAEAQTAPWRKMFE